MFTRRLLLASVISMAIADVANAADWKRFRGPDGSAISDEKGLPTEWSESKNIVWKTTLPGPGTSSPITQGDRIYVTAYSGYGLEPDQGDMNKLMRHVLCLDRNSGKIVWQKEFKPLLPESTYRRGNGSRHGYSSSTATTDGKHLYIFFGKSGVYCLDLDGKEVWHTLVGNGLSGWGSSNSPVLYKNLVIVNASVESRSLIALDKRTGKEVWRADNVRSSWNTPVFVDVPDRGTEMVLSASAKVIGLNPDTGKQLWHADVFSGYVCPSVVAQDGVIYALQRVLVAIRAGGQGDVTKTHVLWETKRGATVPSPVFYKGHIYWARNGAAYCVDAKTGESVYQERLQPGSGTIYASPVIADGKIYYVSQQKGTYVVQAGPKFKQIAHNTFADDNSRTNASPVVSNGQLLLRTDKAIYCLGNKQ